MIALWVVAGAAAQPFHAGLRLERARQLLAEDNPQEAVRWVNLVLAEQPGNADAHTVAGLAHFAADELELALKHFERAIALGGDGSQRALSFNRGSCLLELGQAQLAEEAFLSAAQSDALQLACLGQVNAGFAALDQGGLRRALNYLHNARYGSSCAELSAVVDELAAALLEALMLAGDESLEAEHYGEAQWAWEAAVPLAGADRQLAGVLRGQAGVAAYLAGHDRAAMTHMAAVLHEDVSMAESLHLPTYWDHLSGGLRYGGRGLAGVATVFAGYDNNVLQASNRQDLAQTGVEESPFAGLRLYLSHGLAQDPALYLRTTYSGLGLGYSNGEQQALSYQDHELRWDLEYMLGTRFRLGAGVYVGAGLSGLETVVGRSVQGGGSASVAYQGSRAQRVSLAVDAGYTAPLSEGFEFLKGERFGVELSYRLRVERWRFTVAIFARSIGMGAQAVPGGELLPVEQLLLGCVDEPGDCEASYRVPLGYDMPGALAWASYQIGALTPMLRVQLEGRYYHAPYERRLLVVQGQQWVVVESAAVETQRDLRLALSVGSALELSERVNLFLGYDLQLGVSNVQGSQRQYGDEEFQRHMVVIEASAVF